jgi:hypothetical protein
VLNLLVSSLLTKHLKIKIYRILTVPVVLYGCETWSLTMKKQRRINLSEDRVLWRIFGSNRDEVTESGENQTKRSFMICTAH